MNPLCYIFLSISVYIEVLLATGIGGKTPYPFAFNDKNDVTDGGKQSKQMVQNVFSTDKLNRLGD